MITTPEGFRVDPENGVVYGLRGRSVSFTRHGYVQCKRIGYSLMAHRIIWEAVHGPIPCGMQINHINGIKNDNRIANLEVVTPSENVRHAYATGLATATGEANGRALLAAADVAEMRRRHAAGESKRSLAREFGVSATTARQAINGERWGHVAEGLKA